VLHYSAHFPPESWCLSPRRDPARSTTTLPSNPHQRMGRLLVGFYLGITTPPALAISQGSRRAITTRQWLSLATTAFRLVVAIYRRIVACHRYPMPIVASPSSFCGGVADSPHRRADAPASPKHLVPASPPLCSLQLSLRMPKMKFRYSYYFRILFILSLNLHVLSWSYFIKWSNILIYLLRYRPAEIL
jgi:hypothetical protein